MNIAFKIALRYFKGKKNAQAINIVSWISIGAVTIATAAMVILFSIFNGLESYVKSMYTAFYPEIKISAKQGKFFDADAQKLQQLKAISGIDNIGYSIEDMALLDGYDHQKVIKLKGVDNNWFKVNGMDSFMSVGTAIWPESYAEVPSNVGAGIVAEMGIDVNNPFLKIQLYYPNANANFSGMDLANALNGLAVAPYASFSVQAELDGQYFLIPLQEAQNFFGAPNKISALEISLKDASQLNSIKNKVQQIMGDQFEVQSRIEQNKILFMATQMEKWMIFGILTLVLVIASFNMVGALSMLAIEKKLDISILKTMGASKKSIRSVFLFLGIIIAAVGGIIGIVLGLIVILSQLQWGWLNMGAGLIDAYPVQLQFGDFIIISITVILVGLIAGWYPAIKASKQNITFRDE